MKRIFAALALPALALSLAACDSKSETETTPAQSETAVVEEAESAPTEEVVVEEEVPATDTVLFAVTSTGGGTVSLSIDGSSIQEPIDGEWTREVPIDEVTGVVTLIATGDATEEQTVTCSISDGSGVLKDATATGKIPIASCLIPVF